jgi:uncharacterized protein YecT (DUF1311 family)
MGHCAFPQDQGCKDAATTAAMRTCENSRYERSEQKLNAEYGRLMKQLDRSRQEKLRAAQRAWLSFRDANAAFVESEAENGSLAPILKISALADMTEARALELARIGKQ